MSETVDVNLLVYATDTASPYYSVADELLQRLGRGPEPLYLLWPVISGYLRVSTHPKASHSPLSPTTARSNLGQLLARPHVRTVGETAGFWPIYARTCAEVDARGNLVPDAHLVALMRQHGIGTIWTHDRGFRRFDGIRVRDPFAAAKGRG